MKSCIYVLGIVFASPLLLLADDNLDKDIQDSLASIGSMTYIQQQEKMDIETERLVKKYGPELAAPIKALATERDDMKRKFGLSVLVKLGPCDSVKQAFLDLLKNSDSLARNGAVYALAKIDKVFARKVAIEALNTTTEPYVKESIIPLLSVSGDPNALAILKSIEDVAKENVRLKESVRQARESLEYGMNLPTKEQQESWIAQAYVYWLLPKEIEGRYRGIRLEYFKKAELLAECGHRFSLSFLKYHLSQKDPLAAAIIGRQKEKDAVEDLKVYMNEKGKDPDIFRDLCRSAYKQIEEKEP